MEILLLDGKEQVSLFNLEHKVQWREEKRLRNKGITEA